MGGRLEQRHRLRSEALPPETTLIVRGGRDTVAKLRTHAARTARAWALDDLPLLGVSVFAVLDGQLEDLLRARFATFRWVYLTTVTALTEAGFRLLPTGRRPHYTIRLDTAEDAELERLLVALGPARENPQYGHSPIWRKEG